LTSLSTPGGTAALNFETAGFAELVQTSQAVFLDSADVDGALVVVVVDLVEKFHACQQARRNISREFGGAFNVGGRVPKGFGRFGRL
jgi:hypothetical protein